MTESLCDLSVEPAVLTIQGKQYTLRRLRIADFAAAQEYIRDRRINAVFRPSPIVVNDMVRAASVAEVVCRSVTMTDVLADSYGELYLLHLALRDKAPQATIEWLAILPDLTRKLLDSVMFYICGIPRPEAEESRPLELPVSEVVT